MEAGIPSEISGVLPSDAQPRSSVTLTVRIIKSFQFRTQRSLVLHNIDLDTTTIGQLKDTARQGKCLADSQIPISIPCPSVAVLSQSGWKPYHNVVLGASLQQPESHHQ